MTSQQVAHDSSSAVRLRLIKNAELRMDSALCHPLHSSDSAADAHNVKTRRIDQILRVKRTPQCLLQLALFFRIRCLFLGPGREARQAGSPILCGEI